MQPVSSGTSGRSREERLAARRLDIRRVKIAALAFMRPLAEEPRSRYHSLVEPLPLLLSCVIGLQPSQP